MSSDTIATRFGSGQAVRRVEDDTLLTGKGKYADDFMPPGQLFMQFLRSPYPHARITAIDTTAAREMPGVVAVYTGADLVAAGVQPLPGVAGFPRPDGSPAVTPDRHPLAVRQVEVEDLLEVYGQAEIDRQRDRLDRRGHDFRLLRGRGNREKRGEECERRGEQAFDHRIQPIPENALPPYRQAADVAMNG